eukprot:scaffold56327_cov68-Phaeocystis_antarctica.AAC.11
MYGRLPELSRRGGQTTEDGLGVGWCGLKTRVWDMQDRPLGQWKARTVQTGSIMISAVIEHMYWSGTTASLASDLGPAAPLPPPSPPSAVARSSVSASASAAAAASVAAATAAVAATALDAAATRVASSAATSRTRSAASSPAASAAASRFALRSASCCASSSLSHRACASAPTPPSRTSRGTAASAALSADGPPPVMAARSAASALSAADMTGSGAAASGEAGAASGEAGAASGASLGSSPAAAARPALFFFLDFFEGAFPLACPAASLASNFSIAASARATCGGAACCRMGSAVFVRPCALACRCQATRCWPGPALSVRLKATVAIAPSTTESTTKGQASGTRAQHRARPRPSERHDACCRMSSTVAVWPWYSACCRAVKPFSSSSSVLALARSRAFTHASCPLEAA